VQNIKGVYQIPDTLPYTEVPYFSVKSPEKDIIRLKKKAP